MNKLAIDFGTGWTSTLFVAKNNSQSEFKSVWSDNPRQHISFLLNIIKKLEIDLVIYEGHPQKHKIEDRPHFKNYWQIFSTVVKFCQANKIKGCPFWPWEVSKYRDEERKYKWIVESEMKEKYPLLNVREQNEQAERDGYLWIGEKRRNELDAQCLYELWAEKVRVNDESFLEERNRIHCKKPEFILIPDRGRTKTERLNQYNRENLKEKTTKNNSTNINPNELTQTEETIKEINNTAQQIINKNFKISWWLPQYNKYTLSDCASSCWNGKYCNNCYELGNQPPKPKPDPFE